MITKEQLEQMRMAARRGVPLTDRQALELIEEVELLQVTKQMVLEALKEQIKLLEERLNALRYSHQ